MADDKALPMAYAMKRRTSMSKGGACPDCDAMAKGGEACMAHGGMTPEPSTTSGSPTLDKAVRGESASDGVMRKRMMAHGGMVEEDDFEPEVSFSSQHDDTPEGVTNAPEDEMENESLSGQIVKRRMRR